MHNIKENDPNGLEPHEACKQIVTFFQNGIRDLKKLPLLIHYSTSNCDESLLNEFLKENNSSLHFTPLFCNFHHLLKFISPGQKSYALAEQCALPEIGYSFEHHNALDDTKATFALMNHYVKKFYQKAENENLAEGDIIKICFEFVKNIRK